MITEADLIPYIPRAWIAEATDDSGSGAGEPDASILEQISRAAKRRAASPFGGQIPRQHAQEAKEAAICYACETLLNRRGYSDRQNPYAQQARDWDRRLRALAGGEEASGGGGAGVVAEPVRASSGRGLVV